MNIKVMVRKKIVVKVATVLLLLSALEGCGGGGSSGTTTATMNAAPLEVTLGGNAKLLFPKGSLPENIDVETAEVAAPTLPDEFTVVGKSYLISVGEQPLRPVEVTLPVPSGEDARELAIIRVESSGRISMLQTSIDNGTLVARTPGFSVFTVVRLERFYEEYAPRISGPEFLPINTAGEYHESVSLSNMPGLQAKWSAHQFVDGAIRNLPVSSIDAIFQNSSVSLSVAKASTVDLRVEVLEPITGVTAVAYKSITVVESLESGDALDITIRGPGVVKMAESVTLQAKILNTDITNIREWAWSIDGSEVIKNECDSCTMDLYTFDEYALIWVPGKHTVAVTATDQHGVSGTAEFDITVLDQQVRVRFLDYELATVNLLGEQVTKITNNALIMGGVPPYTYKWDLLPTDEQETHYGIGIDADSFEAIVHQPGGYKLDLVVYDSNGAEGQLSRYPNIPAGPMEISFTGLPAGPVKANEPFTFTLSAKGSFLISQGKTIPGYQYFVYWDNGSNDEGSNEGPIIAANPKDGGSVTLGHSYSTPGKKTLFFYVTPLGWKNHWSSMNGGETATIDVECRDDEQIEHGVCIGTPVNNSQYYKPAPTICENLGGTWHGGVDECQANWQVAMNICNMPTEIEWYEVVTDCGGEQGTNNIGDEDYQSCIADEEYLSTSYWSSTYYSETHSVRVSLAGGFTYQQTKSSTLNVRCESGGGYVTD